MPWSRVLLEKLTRFQLVKKFTVFYGAWRFITAFTSAHHLSLSWVPGVRLSVWTFCNKIHFYGEELLAPRPTPKLEDHPLSAVRDCLFNIFAATLHIGGRSSIRNLRTRHAVVTGTHLSWSLLTLWSDGFYWLKSHFLVNILPNVSFLLQNKRPEGSDSSYARIMLENDLPDMWKETLPNYTALLVSRSTKMQKMICTQMTITC
jgi:hypothetical protein